MTQNTPFTFLICTERSGSNLLTNMLNGHPDISAPPPSHLFRLFASNAANYGALDKDANWRILLQDVVQGFAHQLGSWNTALTVPDLLARDLPRAVIAPIAELYRAEAAFDGATMVFVKENHTARFADVLQRQLPGCRFVYMVRDPRDVAASYLATDSMPGGVERAVDVWATDQAKNQRLQQATSDQSLHALRYEDLLADAPGCLSQISAFLGLEYDPAMLAFHRDARTRRNAKRIDAWKNLAKPVLSGNSGKYRQSLSVAEIEYIELRCHELMRAFGYMPDIVTNPPDSGVIPQRCAKLLPQLRPGAHKIATPAEIDIRARRLAMIETVKARQLR